MLKENRASQFYIRFNREYGEKLDCKSIAEISNYFDIPITVLQDVYERGASAYEIKNDCTNEKINTKQYHGRARVYRFVLNVDDIRTGKKKYKKMRVLLDRDYIKSTLKN